MKLLPLILVRNTFIGNSLSIYFNKVIDQSNILIISQKR